jgi:DNA polymerase-3 subunit chi
MNTRTDLYIVRGTEFTELAQLACKLSEKILSNQNTALILCHDDTQARSLDEQMWSFKDAAFLPHEQRTSPNKDYPIAISTLLLHEAAGKKQGEDADALIYLSPFLLQIEPRHSRRLILVNSEESNLSKARSLYKKLKTAGGEVHYHDLR